MYYDYYCILPSGNSDEFPELDAELIARGVNVLISDLRDGCRIYRIPESELGKLPVDEKGPYLGDDRSGHSIYRMLDAEHNRISWDGSEWTSLKIT